MYLVLHLIYHGATKTLSLQASSVGVRTIGWRIIESTWIYTKPALCVSMHTDIDGILSMLSSLCVVYKWRKWHHKWNHSSWVSGFKHLLRLQSCEKVTSWYTAQCKMLLFCAVVLCKTMKESHNFELAHLKKKRRRQWWSKQKEHFGHLMTFRFGTFAMLRILWRWMVHCHTVVSRIYAPPRV